MIAEGNFRAGSAVLDGLPAARVVQVHVTAEPDELRRRMLDRAAHRHAVHWDGEAAEQVAGRAAAGEWPPLPLAGDLVEVDTTTWPDLGELTTRVARLM